MTSFPSPPLGLLPNKSTLQSYLLKPLRARCAGIFNWMIVERAMPAAIKAFESVIEIGASSRRKINALDAKMAARSR